MSSPDQDVITLLSDVISLENYSYVIYWTYVEHVFAHLFL